MEQTSSRASAKQKVADSWANRRRESHKNNSGESAPKQRPTQLPVCQVLRQVWEQLTLDVHHRLSSSSSSSNRNVVSKSSSPRVFPSVVSILQASAVARQVERLQQEQIAMDVLPAGYDWQRAIQKSTQTREGAFLLLDLSAVVKSHLQWSQVFEGVQLQYRVQHNRDSKLLALFGRLGVGLRLNSSHDVSVVEEGVDDFGRTRKPNGYLRRYFQKGGRTVAVDGPEEVQRIYETCQMLRQRHGLDCQLEFVLKLPRDCATWDSLVQATQQACDSTNTILVGVSIELMNDKDYLAQVQDTLDHIQSRIAAVPMKVDITGTLAENMAPFLTSLAKMYNVTADASDLLVAHAGALCTRIIGVKEADDTRHLYIDDGCYGSLTGQNYTPLPLDSCCTAPTQTTTVWGPTCDGLDRVCQNVVLPEMHVDEWLVFPDMGLASGMSTAFNGFDPPDIAYCVLGYFRHLYNDNDGIRM